MFRAKPPIDDREIRATVVGCGRISKNHFAAIEKHA
jgi:UDP-N-acetyl-2-amino-2-deoxyglucuronate dehydrogenase